MSAGKHIYRIAGNQNPLLVAIVDCLPGSSDCQPVAVVIARHGDVVVVPGAILLCSHVGRGPAEWIPEVHPRIDRRGVLFKREIRGRRVNEHGVLHDAPGRVSGSALIVCEGVGPDVVMAAYVVWRPDYAPVVLSDDVVEYAQSCAGIRCEDAVPADLVYSVVMNNVAGCAGEVVDAILFAGMDHVPVDEVVISIHVDPIPGNAVDVAILDYAVAAPEVYAVMIAQRYGESVELDKVAVEKEDRVVNIRQADPRVPLFGSAIDYGVIRCARPCYPRVDTRVV